MRCQKLPNEEKPDGPTLRGFIVLLPVSRHDVFVFCGRVLVLLINMSSVLGF